MPQIRAAGERADAKFQLYWDASVAYHHDVSAKVLTELMSVAEARQDEIERAWNEHFG